MKLNNKHLVAALIGFAAILPAAAQGTASGYFLENYNYRYQLNPAFGNEKSFVSIPGVGNLNVATRGSLQLSSVIYTLDGHTVLFTNPGISIGEVMDGISDCNKIGADVKVNILSGGFKAWGGYNTISINAVASVNASIPGAFFSLAKEGVRNTTYDISDMRASGMGYAEIGLGHSREIQGVPGLRIGATMKFLVGLANMEAYFHEANLTLGENEWIGQTNADIYANIGSFQYEHKINKDTGREYVSGCNFDGEDSFGPNGFGIAFDLGAAYQWKDFEFSLAVLDLGFISFSDTKHASTNGTHTVNTDSYTFNVNDNAENSFENEWDRLKDDLEGLYQPTDMGNVGSRSRMLGATVNVGVDYTLPMYKKIKFGLLNTTRVQGKYSWTEFRLSANYSPVKCLSANVNGVVGSYSAGFGWLINVYTSGINFFVGMDHTLGKVTKQFAPLNSNASVNFGLNVPF